MAHDVFISHSTEDKAIADAVCAALESEGVRCWVAPRDILPGHDWAGSIVEAITRARAMILIYSGSSSDSTHVKKELTLAIESNTVILPLRIENIPLTGIMHYYLADTHWLDVMNPPTENEIRKLVEVVRSLLNVGDAQTKGAASDLVAEPVRDTGDSGESGIEAVPVPTPPAAQTQAPAPGPQSTQQAMPGHAQDARQASNQFANVSHGSTPNRSGTAPWVWVVAGVVALCVAGAGCLGVTLLLSSGGDDENAATPPVPVAPAMEEPAPAEEPPEEDGRPARVQLTWDETIDLDLEIWSGDGSRFLDFAWDKGCMDIQDGRGPEYFEFKQYSEGNYSQGNYVVSVCFPDGQADYEGEVPFTLTMTLADGSTVERSGVVAQAQPKNQWHAFVLDAETGDIINDLDIYVGDLIESDEDSSSS